MITLAPRTAAWAAVSLLLGLGMALGCDRGTGATAETRTETVVPPAAQVEASAASGPSLLSDVTALRAAEAALNARLGKSISALELRIEPGQLLIQARDPAAPERVVQYEYRSGVLSEAVPVQLQGPGRLEDNLFPLAEARLASVPGLVRDALAQTGADGARIRSVVLRRNLPHGFDVRFRVYIDGSERAQLEADARGKLLDPS